MFDHIWLGFCWRIKKRLWVRATFHFDKTVLIWVLVYDYWQITGQQGKWYCLLPLRHTEKHISRELLKKTFLFDLHLKKISIKSNLIRLAYRKRFFTNNVLRDYSSSIVFFKKNSSRLLLKYWNFFETRKILSHSIFYFNALVMMSHNDVTVAKLISGW